MSRSLLAALALAAGAAAQTVPIGFVVDSLLSSSLNRPTDFCFLPDGRCLIAADDGTLTVYANGAYAVVGIVPAVEFGGERGLLSLAADPQFATNGFLYVWYTSAIDDFMHLDRFALLGARNDPNSTALVLDAPSRRVVLDAIPDGANAHNGGALRFAPDGKLMVSMGDDVDACGARSPSSSLGCLMRIAVAGLPPTPGLAAPAYSQLDPGDNPLSSATDFSQLVIAHGLRNPFRFEIDPATGSVYIADVGEATCEELSEYPVVQGPLPLIDFGWPIREGSQPGWACPGPTPGTLTEPILAVDHVNSTWRSIIAGPRYRNPASGGFGAAYDGDVFVTDVTGGDIRRLRHQAAGWAPAPPVHGQPDAIRWASGFQRLCALRQGPDGCLWFLANSLQGMLGRIRPNGPQAALLAASGSGQRTTAGEPFAAPLVARAYDGLGLPAAGVPVLFSAQGAAIVAATGPIATDALGFAQTNATATAAGGGAVVTAINLSTGATTTFQLFGRVLAVAHTPAILTVNVVNASAAAVPQVPFVLLTAFPGSPSLPTPIGALCIDPSYALAVVLEDGVGIFGGVSFSGGTGVGSPSLSTQYALPAGLLTGQLMRFQAVGLDPIDGWFRTNCVNAQF